jgi:hypothetical protein
MDCPCFGVGKMLSIGHKIAGVRMPSTAKPLEDLHEYQSATSN